MNALRARLTASQDLTLTCANFLLDETDDFIDECKGYFANRCSANRSELLRGSAGGFEGVDE